MNCNQDGCPDRDWLLQRIKSLLAAEYGERLKGVVLYGSEARGEAGPESDVDVLVLLEGPVRVWFDVRTIVRVLYDLVLETGRPIDALPADVEDFYAGKWALYRAVKEEGIFA
jgi:uncharacterized protein